jgi:hypothetical protein
MLERKEEIPTPGMLVNSRIEVGFVFHIFIITFSVKNELSLVAFVSFFLSSRAISLYTCFRDVKEVTAAFCIAEYLETKQYEIIIATNKNSNKIRI